MLINASIENRKALREHAREAMREYSALMSWLLVNGQGNCRILYEPQGQTFYTGECEVVETTGSFEKAHGNGAVRDSEGRKYTTQKAYLIDLLGITLYHHVFEIHQNYRVDGCGSVFEYYDSQKA